MSNRKRTAFTLKCKAKEAPALKKYRGDVLSFAKNIDDSDKHRSLIKTDILYSRKQRRKDERKLKKARKHAYRCGRVLPDMQTWTKSKEDAVKTDTKKKSLQKLKEKKKKQKARMKEVKKMKEKEEIDNRKQQLMEDNKKEDRMLKQLEKNLHLNKRKSKNLPQAFVNDGLDFLLDALDKSPEDMEEEEDYSDEEHEKRKVRDNEDSEQEMDSDLNEEYMENESDEGVEEEEEDYDFSDEDEESDSDDHHQTVDVISEKSADVKSILKSTSDDRQQKQVKFKTVTEENAVKKDKKNKESKKVKKKDVTFDDDDDEAEEEDGSEEEKEGEKSDESSDENIEDTEVTEDIYGRLRDKEGNIVKSSGQSGKYIPPGKRMQISDEKKKFQLERLQKQLKGLVNRASEANMSQIFSQIEAVYRSNSRAEVTEALSAIVIGACVSVTMTPERLAMEMMLLITILHGNIGTEVGAMFLQTLAQKYKLVCNHGNRLEDKSLDNTVMLFGFLYTFKVVDSVLIFGIIEDLVKSFQEKDIQIILMLLKNVGFTLRKDNPNGLKEVILEIQSAAKSLGGEQSSHVKYMLEVIMAIKNNNMRKIPNYDPEHQEHLKKVARGILRGSTLGEGMLHISLKDLMNAEERGRWWLVGSAWEGPTEDTKPAVKMESIVGDVSAQLLELARKQRMNTDIRKNIFCIIMSSQDYIDAFDKLLRLGLKNQQEREIIHIIVDLCLQEKSFNPFYMLLLQKFCLYHRRFQMSTQFLMWDKFKDMKKLSQLQREHLSQLLSQLLSTKAMSLSVLKVVEFGTLGVHMLRFLKQLIQSVLLDNPEDVTKSVFQRIAPLSKLHHLHEGLKLFMQHFLLRKKSKDVRDTPLLRERIDMAVKVLSSSLHHSQSEFDD